MSKRKQNRSERRTPKADRPDTITRTPSVQRILFPAVLALVVSTAFLLQLSSPRSMLSAIRRVEYLSIEPAAGKAASLADRAKAPGWATIHRVFNAKLHEWAQATQHFALLQLLRDYNDIHRGITDAPSTLPQAADLAAQDADNLVTRLAWADMQDLARESEADATQPAAPLERFEAYRETIEGQHPASQITLYNPEITRQWHEVLSKYIQHRPDVTISITPSIYHYRITNQFEIFPILEQRLSSLAKDLQADGRPREAAICLGWFHRLCLGLLETDTDAATRLLCAELLAKSMEDHPEAAKRLVQLRDDFHAHADAAPINLADQSFVLRPAWTPETLEPAMSWLLIAVTLGLTASGAAAVFLLAIIAGIAAKIRHNKANPETARPWRFIITAPITLIPALFAVSLLFRHYHHHGIYSETWGIATAINIAAIGALATVALAGLFIKLQDAKQQRRAKLVGMIALIGFATLAIPPATVAWIVRYVDLLISFLPILILAALALLGLSLWLTPARMRRVAAVAALLWCTNSCAAFVLYQIHRSADKHYQQSVIDHGFDEVSARLGPDWKKTYLSPVRKALAQDAPADTPTQEP